MKIMSDIYKHLGRDISLLYRYNSMYMERNLEALGIHHGQVIFMAQLFSQDGLTQEELTKILSFDKGTTAKALKKLELIGYVKKQADERDSRCNRIFLTQKARGIEQSFFNVLEEYESIATTNFSEDEVALLTSLLKSMSLNVHAFNLKATKSSED